jgi:hypothetical protein
MSSTAHETEFELSRPRMIARGARKQSQGEVIAELHAALGREEGLNC